MVQRLHANSLRPATVHSEDPDVVMLSSGDVDFATPAVVTRAAVSAVNERLSRYGDLRGDPELREEVAGIASARSGHRYGAADVVVTNGASSGAWAAMMAMLSPGDKVLLTDPTYSLFEAAAHMADAIPVHVPLDPTGHLDIGAMAEKLPGCKVLVLVNPSNPTGAVFTRGELTALAELTVRHGVVVISDEVCDRFTFDDREFASAIEIDGWRDRLIYCQSMSKTSAMSGWRVGYTVAMAPLVDDIRAVHRTTLTAVNSIAQRAALAALQEGLPWATEMRDVLQQRRDMAIAHLATIPEMTTAIPEGGLFVFPRYDDDRPSMDVVREMSRNGVMLRAGREFGPSGEGHLRIALTSDMPTLEAGLNRVGDFLALRNRAN